MYPASGPIKLSSLRLANVRCFKDLSLDFSGADHSRPAPWTVLLGNNASGKSTVLKALALALVPTQDALALFAQEQDSSPWLRHQTSTGLIRADYLDPSGKANSSVLVIQQRGSEEQLLFASANSPSSPVENASGYLTEAPLICGYGAARRVFGTSSPRGRSVRDAVGTLFNIEARLQNPELAVRRLVSASPAGEQDILGRMDEALNLPKGSTRLGSEGLEVSGPWGSFMPVGSLSDGYRATLSWLLDFIGWSLLRSRSEPDWTDRSPAGIVLIDEIEQHLHPRWQRRILGRLRTQLPNVQFVVTTHAPLCVTGTTDLSDDEVNLFHLGWQGDSVVSSPPMKPPRGQRADQVLTSYLFGLETTSDDQTKERIERLSVLLSRGESLGEAQRREVEDLRVALHGDLGAAETETEALVGAAVERVLDDRLRARIGSSIAGTRSPDREVARFEARRQLLAILEDEPSDEGEHPEPEASEAEVDTGETSRDDNLELP
jgi:energy-coupling factor transporter ATP-binding protein EcfA2